MALYGAQGGIFGEFKKDQRSDQEIQDSRGDETSDNNHCDGMKDFLSGLIRGEDEWNERYACGKCGHEDGHHPLECAALDHRAGEAFALVAHEVQVVGEHHNAVSGRNASYGDESDQRGDADIIDE